MRLFVAADISDETRAELRRVRSSIEGALTTARTQPRVTWVNDEAAHVTLRFIGEVSDETGSVVESALTQAFEVPPFEVRWDTIGSFPDGRSPRVIWIGVTSGAEQLGRLASLVDERLAPVLGLGEARPFKPHLTVARIKEPGRGVAWSQTLRAARPKPTTTLVDHVTLYRSRPSSMGHSYTALVRTLLV